VLADNGADPLTISANGSFSFGTPVPSNGAYKVTIATQPARQSCTVSMGSGSAVAADVTTVIVTCIDLTKTWVATGSMATSRAYFVAVLLPSGNVLVAGGEEVFYQQADSGNQLAATAAGAELYDPATAAWSSTASMSTPRERFAATLLADGTVLAAGGIGFISCDYPCNVAGSGSLASAEIYDPAAGTWTATAGMSAARTDPTSTLLQNGMVLVAGGEQPGVASFVGPSLASTEIYDPAVGTWNPTGNMQTARSDHTATLLPTGKVLVAGGDQFDSATYTSTSLASAEVYDPAAGIWTATGSMNVARDGFTATLLPNGTVLVAGGGAIGIGSSNSAEIYDPVSGAWTPTGSMAIARTGHTATLLANGTVLVTGGDTSGIGAETGAEIYDHSSGTWTATGSLNLARAGHSATLLPDGTVLAAGGYENVTNFFVAANNAEICLP
jgi:ribosomal protein S10